jgi:tRNA(fMet)-specific endonuclease VapC
LKYLLDTETFSELARGRNPALAARIQAIGMGQLAVSVVSEGEIRYGQALRPVPSRLAITIDALFEQIQRLPLGLNAVEPYARVRAGLRRAGAPIGPNELWIAAQAVAEDLTLVSGNEREYARVPGLRVENWLR